MEEEHRKDLTLVEKRIKHLEMIQAIITRMASNSFALKGWAVTLVAGIFALSSKEADKLYFLIAYVPIIIFWGLDTYYLRQERLFRCLYNSVRVKSDTEIDFCMNTSEFKSNETQYQNCLLSTTEIWFYLPLALLSTGVIIITYL